MAQAMIRLAALPKSFWALAMATAVHVRNRVHSEPEVYMSPWRPVNELT
jgi:hypothetical protein